MCKKTQSGNWGNEWGCHNQRQDKNFKPPLLKITGVISVVFTPRDKKNTMLRTLARKKGQQE